MSYRDRLKAKFPLAEPKPADLDETLSELNLALPAAPETEASDPYGMTTPEEKAFLSALIETFNATPGEPGSAVPRSVTCATCVHFERTDHPNLGHCLAGEPEAPAGLWDTDARHCPKHHLTAALQAMGDALEERAGILQFDAGLPRHEAETQARRLVQCARCQHFEPDDLGFEGIGTCRVGMDQAMSAPTAHHPGGVPVQAALYPQVERICLSFTPSHPEEIDAMSYPLPPEGTHPARCCWVVDLGTQSSTWEGRLKSTRKLLLGFELLISERRNDGQPHIISKRYTRSLHKLAVLRQDLERWRGRPFTEGEAETFALPKVAGVHALVDAIHVNKGDATYANLGGLAPWPKGEPKPEGGHEPLVFDLDQPDWDAYETLPRWIQEIIEQSPEHRRHHAPQPDAASLWEDDDDIHF